MSLSGVLTTRMTPTITQPETPEIDGHTHARTWQRHGIELVVVDYSKPFTYVLDSASAYYLGGRYFGSGFLFWDPETGFRLEALVERKGPLPPPRIEFGRVGVVEESERSTIRLKTRVPPGSAFIPRVPLVDRFDLLNQDRLSLRVNRVIFSLPELRKSQRWLGRATYDVGTGQSFPDSVGEEIRVAETRVREKESRAGIHYEDSNKKLIGRMLNERVFELHWFLDRTRWTKGEHCRFPEAFRQALSLEIGRRIELLESEVSVLTRRRVDRRMKGRAQMLDLLSPIRFEPFPNRERLVFLTEFFLRGEEKAEICVRVFDQLLEAARQTTWQSSELLVSTILEALLRTLYGFPFRPDDRSFKINEVLAQFRNDYLNDSWEPACLKALDARKRLRHRNAHPDWLVAYGGSLSAKRITEGLDDSILLCCFYGHMMLALAGWADLKPEFPKPYREWNPTWVQTRVEGKAESTDGSPAASVSRKSRLLSMVRYLSRMLEKLGFPTLPPRHGDGTKPDKI